MPFQPNVGDELDIDGVGYRIAEHPNAPGLPYGQEGRQAVVYQLLAGEERRALKAFKPRYRVPALVSLAEKLHEYADLPGLRVCRRTVLSARRHEALLRQHPDLTYAMLMPWIEGPTWMQVLVEKRALRAEQSLALARSLASMLATLEERGVAHCDLSSPNVLLPALAPSLCSGQAPSAPLRASPGHSSRNGRGEGGVRPSADDGRGVGGEGIALVDVEQLHAPTLDRPLVLPSGYPGYAHKTALHGLWQPDADRFSGAVLLVEMLGWCDERVRQAAWGESYFDPQEMHGDAERYRLLVSVLRERWGEGAATLWEQAWRAEMLADCATFGEWLVVLPELEALRAQARKPDEVAEGLVRGRRLEQKGDLAGALAAYRQAQTLLAGMGSELAQELELVVRDLEQKAKAKPLPPKPQPAPEACLAILTIQSGRVCRITAPKVRVGRNSENVSNDIDLGPDDPKHAVSRRHFRLEYWDGQWHLRLEAGVKNPTYVRGKVVSPGAAVPLRDGDEIRIADIRMTFRVPPKTLNC